MHKQKLTLNTVQNIKVVEELVPRYAHFLYPQPSALQLPEQDLKVFLAATNYDTWELQPLTGSCSVEFDKTKAVNCSYCSKKNPSVYKWKIIKCNKCISLKNRWAHSPEAHLSEDKKTMFFCYGNALCGALYWWPVGNYISQTLQERKADYHRKFQSQSLSRSLQKDSVASDQNHEQPSSSFTATTAIFSTVVRRAWIPSLSNQCFYKVVSVYETFLELSKANLRRRIFSSNSFVLCHIFWEHLCQFLN